MTDTKMDDLSKAKVAASQPEKVADVPVTTPAPQDEDRPLTAMEKLRIAMALRREALEKTYRSERTPSQNKEHFRFYFDGLRGALDPVPPT